MKKFLLRLGLFWLLLALSGCGGTKVLKEPNPLAAPRLLATASDQNLSAALGWVIFRDGPGTWAKNVDWDEYLIRVQNLGDDSLQITKITVVDSLGTQIESGQNRKQLVKGSKETKRRYKGAGLKVKAGLSGKVLAGGAGVGAAVIAGGGATGMAAAPAVAGVAVLAIIPVLAVAGVIRGVNNSKVNDEIEARQTLLPVVLQKEEVRNLDIFFSLSPSPRKIEIIYADSQGGHTLVVDTQTALEGLHLIQAAE